MYRARVVDTAAHEVALKSLHHIDARTTPLFRQRFDMAARARHPNLVTLYELDLSGDGFYAMELVTGVNVLTWVAPRHLSESVDTVPSRPRALRADLVKLRGVMRQIADGISALHDAGLRHDNLKPSNVLVTEQGRAVLTDFGLTDAVAQHTTFDNSLSETGTYMSPEQAGAGVLTTASDWYAVGVILYEALTGRLPFDGDKAALVSRDPLPPSAFVDGVPHEIDELCKRLLGRDPARRGGRNELLEVFEEDTAAEPAPAGENASNLPGTGRFDIVRQLGRGGMGIVYEAFDRERGMQIALKTLLRLDAGALYRFKQEFRALVDVAHPNLVTLYELVADSGQWFFTMELLTGVDFVSFVRGRSAGEQQSSRRSADMGTRQLSDSFRVEEASEAQSDVTRPLDGGSLGDKTAVEGVIAAGTSSTGMRASRPTLQGELSPIDWTRLRDALLQLAHGVHALHSSGHMHRDIKPSNVHVTPDGRVVLLDFGVIAEVGAKRPGGTHEMVGTPSYMAPEQARGKITKASDWYAVGVMLYRVLTGSLPYVGTVEEILFAKQDYDPVSPDSFRSDLPVDLVLLCMQLLDRDPERRPTGEDVLSRLGATAKSRSLAVNLTSRRRMSHSDDQLALAGREGHLANLLDAFASVRRGAGETLLVHGSSGMGKSVLIDEFLDDIKRTPDAVVLAGRCYEREQVPYKGVDAAIDALSRYLLSLPEDDAAKLAPRDLMPLARVFPVLESVPMFQRLERRVAATPEPQELRRRAFAALRTLLANIARRGPLVVFIDDAQWGDRDSAPLLAELMRPPDVPPLLLLLSYRSEDAARSPLLSSLLDSDGLLSDGARTRKIEVGPLAEQDAYQLAARLLDDDVLAAQAASTIARESNGHPYFIHELARYVREEGVTGGMALSLDAVIAKRVQRLPSSARMLMEITAVAGQPISQALIGRATGVDTQERAALINQLRVAQLIRTSGVGDADLAECYHDRIRELLVSQLPPARLADNHARVATAMLQEPAPDPEALAIHFQGAGDVRQAFEYATKAADRAAEALAFDRAANLYRVALDFQPPPDVRRSLNERLGDALRSAGRGADAAAAYLSAADGALVERRLVLQRLAAEQLLYSGHLDDGLRIIDDVLSSLKLRLSKTPTRALASLLWRRAHLRLRGIDYKPHTVAEVPPQTLQLIDTCYGIGTSLAIVDPVRANNFQTLNFRLSLDAGEPYRIARSLALEAGFVSTMGASNLPRVTMLLDKAQQIAQQVDNPHATAMHRLASGIAAYETGQIREAATHCEAAEELLVSQCNGVSWELASSRLFGTWSRYRLGDIRYLVERVPILAREAEERGDLYGHLAMSLGCPRIAMTLFTDRAEEQRALAQGAIARWPGNWYQVQNYWADYALFNIELYADAPEQAWERMARTWPILSKALLLRVEEVHIYMSEVRARIALALALRSRSPGKYLAMVERDARMLAKKPIAWCGAMASLLRAQAAALTGNVQREHQLLVDAHRIFEGSQLAAYEVVTRLRLGVLAGGELLGQQVAVAQTWAHTSRVANLTGLTRMLAPVFAMQRPVLPSTTSH